MKRFTRYFRCSVPVTRGRRRVRLTPRELNAGPRGGRGGGGGRRAEGAEEEGDGGGGGGSARGGGFWRVNVFFLFSGIEERVTRELESSCLRERALFKARRTIIIASLIAELCNKTFCKYKPSPSVRPARARSICSRLFINYARPTAKKIRSEE